MPRGMLLFDQPSIVRPIRAAMHTSREAKIGKLEVPILVYQYIIRLDVSARTDADPINVDAM